MKGSTLPWRRILSPSALLLASVCWLGLQQSQATTTTLTSLNSSVQVDSDSQAGMFNWTVDGYNALQQQWFWYRIGNNAEAPINTISPAVVTSIDSQHFYADYTASQFTLRVDYRLTGSPLGSGASHVDETVTINNVTATTLDFHFFQYSHFTLTGSGGDTIQLGKDNSGKFNEAFQTNGPIRFVEAGVTPGAEHGEAALSPATLNKLSNGSADTLNDNVGPVTGDVTWAFEWDRLLAPNGSPNSSLIVSKNKDLQVPEPSALALFSLGLLAYAWRRRFAAKG